MKKLNIKGDTIVEVLVSLALTSMVIAAVYTTANKSLLGARQSQERLQAMKIAESQAEELRIEAPKIGYPNLVNCGHNGNPACVTYLNFCFLSTVAGGNVQININQLNSQPNLVLDSDTLSNSTYNNCKTTSGGISYYIWINRAAGTDHKFIIHIRWLALGRGNLVNEATLNYTVY